MSESADPVATVDEPASADPVATVDEPAPALGSAPGPGRTTPGPITPPTRRPRVALALLDAGSRSGTAHAAHELIRRARGELDFVVVSTRLAAEVRPLVEWLRIPAPSSPFRLRWLAFYLAAGLRLRSAGVDLIHTLAPAPLLPQRVDLATVLFSQAAFFAGGAPAHGLPARLARWFSVGLEHRSYRPGRVRLLSALSSGGRRELERLHPGVPVIVTPHVLDRARFHPDAASRAELRSALGVDESDVVALFVNNHFWEHKGLAIAIRSFARARREAPGLAELWVVGTGPAERFREVARAEGVLERVRFLGWRDDIERLYRSADLLVHPATYETFSLAVHEAAACGLAVVATRVNGVEDLLAGGDAGILVERSDEAVTTALLRLVRDAGLRRGMGEAGRRRVAAFAPEAFTDRVLAAYRELLPDG